MATKWVNNRQKEVPNEVFISVWYIIPDVKLTHLIRIGSIPSSRHAFALRLENCIQRIMTKPITFLRSHKLETYPLRSNNLNTLAKDVCELNERTDPL